MHVVKQVHGWVIYEVEFDHSKAWFVYPANEQQKAVQFDDLDEAEAFCNAHSPSAGPVDTCV